MFNPEQFAEIVLGRAFRHSRENPFHLFLDLFLLLLAQGGLLGRRRKRLKLRRHHRVKRVVHPLKRTEEILLDPFLQGSLADAQSVQIGDNYRAVRFRKFDFFRLAAGLGALAAAWLSASAKMNCLAKISSLLNFERRICKPNPYREPRAPSKSNFALGKTVICISFAAND